MGLGAAGTAAVVAAGTTAAGGLASGIIGSKASAKAGDQAAAAQQQSAAVQQAMYAQTRDDLMRFRDLGSDTGSLYSNFYKTAADQLGNEFSRAYDHIPQPMTQENLIKTPGYQFNLQQGLRAVGNANAAKGLGVSGAALQGAGRFATGLADSTYQNQFANQQQIFQDYLASAGLKQNQLGAIYGMIGDPLKLAENAAAQTGNIGAQAGQSIGNSLGQAGNALAAGTTGSANALAGGLQSVFNAPMTYLGIQNALNQGKTDEGTWTT
jgi:hypothetical protein